MKEGISSVNEVEALMAEVAQSGEAVAEMRRRRKVNKFPFVPTTKVTYGAYDVPGGDDGAPGYISSEATAQEGRSSLYTDASQRHEGLFSPRTNITRGR